MSNTFAEIIRNVGDLANKLSNLDVNDELFGQKAKEILKKAFDSMKSDIQVGDISSEGFSSHILKPVEHVIDSCKTMYDVVKIVAKSWVELISKQSKIRCASEFECQSIRDKISTEVMEMANFELSNIKDGISRLR